MPIFYLVFILAGYIIPSLTFELDWVTTIEAPEIQEKPTTQQKQHVKAVNDRAITISGESVDIDVLSNDIIHSDKSLLSLSLTSRGKNGYCVIHDDTDFIVYYPKYRYAGYDECVYIVCDAQKVCDSAKVIITIVKAVHFDDESTSTNRPDTPAVDEILDGLNISGSKPETTDPPSGDPVIAEDFEYLQLNEPMHYSNDVALSSYSCPYGHASILIEVQADKYGDDTTWTFTREYEDGTSSVELSGGPYDSNGFDSQHICVPKPSKWKFEIADQYGDGE